MTTVVIHQPEYLPCLGLIDKIRRADTLVILDDVQFNRANLQHRAKIADAAGKPRWLTIPYIHNHPQLIHELSFADPEWANRHLDIIRQTYRKAPAFAKIWPWMQLLWEQTRYDRIIDVAGISMRFLLNAFNAMPKIIIESSTIGAVGNKSDLVLDICRKVEATTYLSGKGGSTYLDRDKFAAAKINIEVQDFRMPWYREGIEEIPGLSALDAWMYLGDEVSEVFE